MLKITDLMLYVGDEWRSVDIDRTASFPFNLQVSDLTDPTATKIPFSLQINLKKTKVNNDIFSTIGRYDSQILNINPIERTPFRLYINNNLYQTGYMKIEQATLSEYIIRLYGGLGDYFYTLSEKKLVDLGYEDDGQTQNAYGKKFEHVINRSIVSNSFRGQSFTNTSNAQMQSYFGYAMTYQGFYDNFDSDTEAISNTEIREAQWASDYDKSYSSPELTEHRRQYRLNGAATGSIVQGEYRSYYQRPMVKLQDIYNEIVAYMQRQGWTTNLDETFFNPSNPYWADTWVMCPQYNIANGDVSPSTKVYNDPPNTNELTDLQKWGQGAVSNVTRQWLLGTINTISGINTNTETLSITFKLPVYLYVLWEMGSSDVENQPGGITVTPKISYDGVQYPLRWKSNNNQQVIPVNSTSVAHQRTKGDNFYVNWIGDRSGTLGSEQIGLNFATVFDLECQIDLPAGTYNPYTEFYATFTANGNSNWYGTKGNRLKQASLQLRPGTINGQKMTAVIGTTDATALRSDSVIEFKDIISSDDSCFDFMMSFNKIFGLYHIKHPVRNEISILTRNSYFALQERLDWTRKIDYNKNVIVQTLNLDYRYGIFKWQNQDTKYEEKYLSDYSREYGSVIFDTQYKFSDEQDDLMESIIFGNMILASDYSQYYIGRDGILYKDNKTLPYLADNAFEKVDTRYMLCFKGTPVSTGNRSFAVTDDTTIMLQEGYCWNSTDINSVIINQYPNILRTIGTGDSQSSLNFGTPRVAYDGVTNESDDSTSGADTIYFRFWQSYINDIHDANTKIVTCYVNITINDIYTDLFNKFIFIDNVPFVLNKIYGFDPTKHEFTKVDLISVKDINNYVGQSYIAGSMTLQYGGSYIYDSDGEIASPTSPVIIRLQAIDTSATVVINSSIGWKITSYDTDNLTINPTSASAGNRNIVISFLANNTGLPITYSVPIQWGNTTTILQIIQVSNWSVTTTTNQGTSTANGQTGTIQVPDSSNVTLSTTAGTGYTFAYWTITDASGINYYFGQTIGLTITSDTNAEALWLDSSSLGWTIPTFNITEFANEVTNTLNVPNGFSFTVNAPGLTFSPDSGINTTSVVFNVPENTDTTERTFTQRAVFNNGIESTFNIIQEARKYVIVSPTNETIPATANTITVTVSSNTSWTASAGSGSAPYVTINPSSGTGDNNNVRITVAANATGEERVGIVTFTTANGLYYSTITITQDGYIFPELTIDPETTSVVRDANTYNVDVTSNELWTVTPNDSWLSVNPTSGGGNGSFEVSVEKNDVYQDRTGTITVRTNTGNNDVIRTHTVTQATRYGGAITSVVNNTTGTSVTVLVEATNTGAQTLVVPPGGSNSYTWNEIPIGPQYINSCRITDGSGTATSDKANNSITLTQDDKQQTITWTIS